MNENADVNPRKRPVQQRSWHTVEAILEAATRILEEQGIGSFNTNAIADRAGVGVASLYEYFPCKEAVAAELVLRAHLTLVAALRDTLTETEGFPFERAMRSMIRRVVACECARPGLARVLELEEEILPKTMELLAAEAEIYRLNMSLLARYLDLPGLKQEDIEIAAFDIHCMVRAILDASLDASPNRMESIEERLCRAVIGYLQPLLRRERAA